MKSKTPPKPSPRPTTATLAKQLKVSPRSVRRWRAAGAPVDDPAALRRWIAGNRTTPPRMSGSPKPPRSRKPPAPPAEASGKEGLAASLARLGAAEKEAHRRYLRAAGRGGVEEREALRTWTVLTEQLRRADATAGEQRRGSEVPIPVATAAFSAAVELLGTGLAALEARFGPSLAQLAMDQRAAGEIEHLVGEEVRILRRCLVHATRRFSTALQAVGSEDGQEWLQTVFDSHEKVARAVRDSWELLRTSGVPEAVTEAAWTRFQASIATIHPERKATT